MDGRLPDAVLDLDDELSLPHKQEDAAPRAGVLDQVAHERVEQAVKGDLARDGLGGLQHRAQVERGGLRALCVLRDLPGDEVGVRALETPHRLGRAPAAVGPVCLGQIGAGDAGFAESAEGTARELVGERLVVEIAPALREGDRLVVALPRGARVAANARELRAEQGAAVRQVLRAELRPAREFSGEDLRAGEEERALVRRNHVRGLRKRHAGVEMIGGGAEPRLHGRDLHVHRERDAGRLLERALKDLENHHVEMGVDEPGLVARPAGRLDHLVDVDPLSLELCRLRGLDRELVRDLSDRADDPGDGVAPVELAHRLVTPRLGKEVGDRETAHEADHDGATVL